MKIKTSELIGATLDWAVAVALGWELERQQDGQFIDSDGNRWLAGYRQYAPKISFSPSTNWAQCGPLMEHVESLERLGIGWECRYSPNQPQRYGLYSATGSTELIAICRAVVACKLGDDVEAPDKLVQSCAI